MSQKKSREVRYTFAVICDTHNDFKFWRTSKKMKDVSENKGTSFIKGDIKYMSVVNSNNLRGCYIHAVIETDNARHNRHYTEIKQYIKVGLR